MPTAKTKKTTKKTASKKIVKSPKQVESVRSIPEVVKNALSYKPASRRRMAIILIVIIVAGLLYLGRSLFISVIVNGKPITRMALTKELEKQSGQAVLESLVQMELINQEASKKGITVSAEEIQVEMDKISESVEAQGMTLEDALSYQGQTKADLEENIKVQKTLEKLLADKVSVTDEEISTYFEENKTTYGENPKLEDFKDSISEQIRQEKLSNEFQTWMSSIQQSSKINYFVSF